MLCFELCDVLNLMYMYIVYVYMRYTICNILCIREANSDIRTMTRCGVGNKGNYFDLDTAKFMEPIGLEDFFDAFALDQKRSLKVDAAAALNIPLNDVSDSLVVKQDRANRFELTPVWAPAEPPAKRAKTAEVRLSSASDVPMTPRSDDNAKGSSDEEASDSSGSNSDVSSQDDSSDVSDLEKFEEAYTDFGALTDGVDPQTLERDCSGHPNDEVPGIDLPGGMETLYSLANVPKSWPLATLTIPLSAASKQASY